MSEHKNDRDGSLPKSSGGSVIALVQPSEPTEEDQPDPEVVDALCHLLAAARKGRVKSLLFAVEMDGEMEFDCCVGRADLGFQAMALRTLSLALDHEILHTIGPVPSGEDDAS